MESKEKKEMVMHFLDKVQQLQRTTVGCDGMSVTTYSFGNGTIEVSVFWYDKDYDDWCEIFKMSEFNTEEEMKDVLARMTELIRKSGWL